MLNVHVIFLKYFLLAAM